MSTPASLLLFILACTAITTTSNSVLSGVSLIVSVFGARAYSKCVLALFAPQVLVSVGQYVWISNRNVTAALLQVVCCLVCCAVALAVVGVTREERGVVREWVGVESEEWGELGNATSSGPRSDVEDGKSFAEKVGNAEWSGLEGVNGGKLFAGKAGIGDAKRLSGGIYDGEFLVDKAGIGRAESSELLGGFDGVKFFADKVGIRSTGPSVLLGEIVNGKLPAKEDGIGLDGESMWDAWGISHSKAADQPSGDEKLFALKARTDTDNVLSVKNAHSPGVSRALLGGAATEKLNKHLVNVWSSLFFGKSTHDDNDHDAARLNTQYAPDNVLTYSVESLWGASFIVGLASAVMFGSLQLVVAAMNDPKSQAAFSLGYQISGLVVYAFAKISKFDSRAGPSEIGRFFTLVAAWNLVCIVALVGFYSGKHVRIDYRNDTEACYEDFTLVQNKRQSDSSMMSNEISTKRRYLAGSLFCTIFASACLLPFYAKFDSLIISDYSQSLFFVRLFADASSRPAAVAFKYLDIDERFLARLAFARIVFIMPLILYYTIGVTEPLDEFHTYVAACVVAVYSFLSGFIVTKCYVGSMGTISTRKKIRTYDRQREVARMNIVFSIAMASSTLLGVLFLTD